MAGEGDLWFCAMRECENEHTRQADAWVESSILWRVCLLLLIARLVTCS